MDTLIGAIALYAVIGLVVAYIVHWMEDEADNVVFAGLVWPVLIVIAIGVGLASLLGRLFRVVDYGIGRLTMRRIHSDETGELWRGHGPREPLVMLKVQDSTGIHWIRVSPNCDTAKEAVAWTYHKQPHEYQPIVRV